MNNRHKKVILSVILAVVLVGILGLGIVLLRSLTKAKPEEVLTEYMSHIENREYDAMYEMVYQDEDVHVNQKSFVERNSRIYEGIEAQKITLKNVTVHEKKNKAVRVTYDTMMDTAAGEMNFRNEVSLKDTRDGYKLLWEHSVIFPGLGQTDRISVSTTQAERGTITDRNGKMLAGKGTASSIGVVPGKFNDSGKTIKKLARLLNTDVESIENKLNAAWVEEDSFVPLAIRPKVQEIELISSMVDENTVKEMMHQEEILKIPGTMITDTSVRSYPLEEAASHLVGYVQGVTAEDLEEHPGEGYTENSLIGRSGMEGLYEKELKGQDGCEIAIYNEEGKKKEVLAVQTKKDGEDIQLTIDAELQMALYQQFAEEPGCSVAMNPYTGEVLALVSTPSYDNNDFIAGMSAKQWTALNEDEKQPLYNRFRQIWVPGSAFKPITAAIGLKAGAFRAEEDFGNAGLFWQKDSSWGDYYVTTLHETNPANLTNALIYSDNIYFARAALKIGGESLAESLDELGFKDEIPFEISMTASQYSNSDDIETEVQLADSGYGQGQILMNPLHLASLYTAFSNQGDVVMPYLRYEEGKTGKKWISEAFSPEIAEQVLEGLIGVVNQPGGTGYGAHREDMTLAGKTGTAEIKATTEDTSGTEIGWFSVFTTDSNAAKPILLVSMVENVKELGGSGFVVEKAGTVLDQYFMHPLELNE